MTPPPTPSADTIMTVPDAPIRVGLVVPGESAWVREATQRLTAAGHAVQVCIDSSVDVSPHWRIRLLSPGRLPATVRDPDAATPASELEGVGRVDAFTDIDVVFDLTGRSVPAHGGAALGTWHLTIDPARAGLAETVQDAGAVEIALQQSETGKRRRTSWSRVHRLSPAVTRARALWRAARLPQRVLADLLADRAADNEMSSVGPRQSSVLGLLPRGLRTGVRRRLQRNDWFVACAFDSTDTTDLSTMQHLAAPADRFWADPFPVVDGDEGCIFVEEWPHDLGRGRLAALSCRRDGSWEHLGTVLQEPWHLSHPFVFRWDGETWMIPESSANRSLELYRCVEYPLRWERERAVMEDVLVSDATLHANDDGWWMFATVADADTTSHEELHLFHASSPIGPWTSHPANPVVSDPRRARPAGLLFVEDGQLIRPAQDCGIRYGRALVQQQVTALSATEYREHTIRTVEPSVLGQGVNRLHTLNRDDWLTVVDGHRDRWRWT